jgi:tetratricopeptide (TPR) repeat protein
VAMILKTKVKLMAFDINAVVAAAISRELNHYKEQLLSTQEKADELKPKHASILKTIEKSLSYPNLRSEAVQFFLDIFPTFERWGYWTDCIDISNNALSMNLPPEQQVYLHANLGHIYQLNRNFDDSLRNLNRGLSIAEQHELKELFGLLNHRMMNTYIECKDYKTAQAYGLKALAYLAGKRSKTLAAAYDSLGRVASGMNNSQMAEDYFREALSLWDSLKDNTHMARSYNNLGILFFQQNNLEYAEKCFINSLDALANTASTHDKLQTMTNLGNVYYTSGEFDKAVSIYSESVKTLERELGNDGGWYHLRGALMHNLGNAHLANGNTQQAHIFLNKATTIWQQANDDLELANTIGTIAEAFQADETWKLAIAHYKKALSLLEKYPSHSWAIKLTNDFTRGKKECAEQLKSIRE